MSKERMNDLQDAFEKKSWKVANPEMLFEIEGELIHWNLVRSNTRSTIELEFYIVGRLGQRSYDLRDICYCDDLNSGHTLLFQKRSAETWPISVRDFVRKSCHSAGVKEADKIE